MKITNYFLILLAVGQMSCGEIDEISKQIRDSKKDQSSIHFMNQAGDYIQAGYYSAALSAGASSVASFIYNRKEKVFSAYLSRKGNHEKCDIQLFSPTLLTKEQISELEKNLNEYKIYKPTPKELESEVSFFGYSAHFGSFDSQEQLQKGDSNESKKYGEYRLEKNDFLNVFFDLSKKLTFKNISSDSLSLVDFKSLKKGLPSDLEECID